MELSQVETTAKNYYDSDDAEEFYSRIWGGEDIHIGLYQAGDTIAEASRRTVTTMAKSVPPGKNVRVLDLGAGYGGAARLLAAEHGCKVDCLNLSSAQNDRNRTLTAEAGLDGLIKVVEGSFEELPFADASYDVVWSQDAFLHSGRRRLVLQEATRVLKDSGRMVFTDIMQADDCPDGVLEPILNRIHLESLGSPAFYREALAELGFSKCDLSDETGQLVNHYTRVRAELESRAGELKGHVSDEYVENMKRGLGHWIDGGQQNYLVWGIWVAQK